MKSDLKSLIEFIFDQNILEANPYFLKAMRDKVSDKLQDKKKKVFDKTPKQVSGGNIDDSSGNNDLCDSSDLSSSNLTTGSSDGPVADA